MSYGEDVDLEMEHIQGRKLKSSSVKSSHVKSYCINCFFHTLRS